MAEETGRFLDLKAKTGVQTSETPTMFDHEKRSTSTLMISQTASRLTVYARGIPIPTQRRYHLLCGPLPVQSLAPAPPIHVPCHRVVGSNGDMVDYRWGVERKHEQIRKEATA